MRSRCRRCLAPVRLHTRSASVGGVMQYEVPCECGAVIPVTEEAAGTTARCHCGRPIEVPSLRALRAAAGAPMAAPPEWAIERLLSTGAALRGPCAGCGGRADRVIWCEVECERALPSGARKFDWPLLVLSILFLPVIFFRRRPLRPHEYGRDLAYTVPLRLCAACGAGAHDGGAAAELLRGVPEYRDLLDKYPGGPRIDHTRPGITRKGRKRRSGMVKTFGLCDSRAVSAASLEGSLPVTACGDSVE